MNFYDGFTVNIFIISSVSVNWFKWINETELEKVYLTQIKFYDYLISSRNHLNWLLI